MLAAIFLAAGWVIRRFAAVGPARIWLLVGALALAMMVSAELLLAVVVSGRSLGAYLAGRDPVSGSVYLGMLLVFAAMPALRLWRERRRRPDRPAA